MKHILGIVKPHLDSHDTRVFKVELDYLRLIYSVSEIRKQGEDAQGYFVTTADNILNRLNQLEHRYLGKDYAKVLGISPDGYLRRGERTEKTEILSGLIRAAILDESPVSSSIHRTMREFVLAETILGQEPDVQQVKDANKFPFGVRWDYYGVVERQSGERISSRHL